MGLNFWGPPRRSVVKVRGEQIAERMGATLNPGTVNPDDVHVFITYLPRFPLPPKTVFDPNDHKNQWVFISEHPEIPLIAISRAEEELFRSMWPNRIVFIPDHHANYECEQRPDRPVRAVGTVGSRASLWLDLDDLAARLTAIDITLLRRDLGRHRSQVLDAYRRMDIQIVFRANLPDRSICDALKLSNASSFGIPTVAFPELAYATEYHGCFLPANTVDELVAGVDRLAKDPRLYRYYATRARERSEDYHIDNICDRYRALETLF